MDNSKILKLFDDLLVCYGDKQYFVWLEELSELQKEITKTVRGQGSKEALKEEIADVMVIITQILHTFNITHEEIDDIVDHKLNRTRQRLDDKINLDYNKTSIDELMGRRRRITDEIILEKIKGYPDVIINKEELEK